MLAIIIPCYNEEVRFPKHEFLRFLKSDNFQNIHFYLANDGSMDQTSSLLYELHNQFSETFFVIDNQVNKGKAETIRCAFIDLYAKNQYEWFAYLDADFATHPKELINIFNISNSKQGVKMAMGARWLHLGSEIVRDSKRHYFGRVFVTIASNMLGLKVYDTQCGAKVIHKDYVKILKDEPFISKWIFDVEIFARIINAVGPQLAAKTIIEVPLQKWEDVDGSKIKLKDLLVLPLELFKIKSHYKL